MEIENENIVNNNGNSDTLSVNSQTQGSTEPLTNDDKSDTNSTSSLLEDIEQQKQLQSTPPIFMGGNLTFDTPIVNIALNEDGTDPQSDDTSSTSSLQDNTVNSTVVESTTTTTTTTNNSNSNSTLSVTNTTARITSSNSVSSNSLNTVSSISNQTSRRIQHSKSNSLDRINPNQQQQQQQQQQPTTAAPNTKGDVPVKRTKMEEMVLAVTSGNTVWLTNNLKNKQKIPLTQELPNRSTFLHIACTSFKIGSVMFVFEQAPTLINSQDFNMKTPLYVSCECGFFYAANFLLNSGAISIIPDINKWTPLHKLASLVPGTVEQLPSKTRAMANSSNSINVNNNNNNNNSESPKQETTSTPSQSSQSQAPASSQSQSPQPQASSSQPQPQPQPQQPTQPSKQKVGFTKEIQYEVAAKILSQKSPIIAMRTSTQQTPLHVAITYGCSNLYNLFLSHSTEESLLIKDSDGNTPLHLVAEKHRVTAVGVAKSIFDTLSNLSGEKLQEYIDDVNNNMASALQISMKKNNHQLTRLIIKYRAIAEAKILEEFFTSLEALKPTEATKLPLHQIIYTDPKFRATPFGFLFRKIITIIKQHYSINMTHQNANILLTRAKDTIKRFFIWLDTNITDYEYIRNYKEILFSQTYDVVIHLYHEVYKSTDLFFQQRVARYIDISHSELDITESSWEQNIESFPNALDIMKKLPEKRTPADKINNLNEATSQIVRMDANDLTPMFMFLLIKSDLKNISSEFNFMDDFKETPEQEQYLVLLQGSFDYLETLNYTLRNAQNQVMSLSGLVDRTLDNALSLYDEFQNSGVGADLVEDLDEGLKIRDEMVLLLMMISKLANRIDNEKIYLPLKWSQVIMDAYHFKAIIERLGVRLDQSLELLIQNPEQPQSSRNQLSSLPSILSYNSVDIDNNKVIKKRGEICIILEHPYPQMVYQVIEEKLNEVVVKNNKSDK